MVEENFLSLHIFMLLTPYCFTSKNVYNIWQHVYVQNTFHSKNETRAPKYYHYQIHISLIMKMVSTHKPVINKLSTNKISHVSGQSCNQRGNTTILPDWIN